MMFKRTLVTFILFSLLTTVTQIGGVVLLLCIPIFYFLRIKTSHPWKKFAFELSSFIIVYSICTVLVVPFIAKQFGRVPLPIFERAHIQPANVLTCLLNRNYVRPELKASLEHVAQEMNKKYPGTTINYLDANFPIINKFPLLPHLSHNDGKKLDVSFLYKTKGGERSNEVPSFIGYGVCEEPKPQEYDISSICASQGHWQYNALRNIVSQKKKSEFLMQNEQKTWLISSQHKIQSDASSSSRT